MLKIAYVSIFMITICCLHGMEPEAKKVTAQENFVGLEKLPADLRKMLFEYLTGAGPLEEAVKNIKSLGSTHPRFRSAVNDPKVSEWLIKELAKKTDPLLKPIPYGPPGSRRPDFTEDARLILAAAALNTKESINWLKQYLQDPKHKELAEYLLVQMAGKSVIILDGLLNAGINPNIRSNEYGYAQVGSTGLVTAAVHDYLPGVKRLLAAKADPNIQAGSNGSALMEAIVGGHTAIVQALLQAKADPNLKWARNTPLIFAAGGRKPNLEIVTMLLDAGADINAKDYSNKTALDYAIRESDTAISHQDVYAQIAELLKQRGGKRGSEL